MNIRKTLMLVMALAPFAAVAQPVPSAAPALVFENPTLGKASTGGSSVLKALLTNTTSETIRLTGASTPAARRVMFQHYAKGVGGLVLQRELNQLELLPGKATLLAPGGLEVRLLGLTAPLESGYEIPLTFNMDGTADRTIRVRVTP